MKSGSTFEDFEWWRQTRGYRWVRSGSELLLTPEPNSPIEAYRVGDKDTSGLWMTFANLHQTPEAFLEFANRFGPLGFPVTVLKVGRRVRQLLPEQAAEPHPGDHERSQGGQRAEAFMARYPRRYPHTWVYHSQLMRRLVDLRHSDLPANTLDRLEISQMLNVAVRLSLQDDLTTRLRPVSLVGAMWLQLAVGRHQELRECAVCDMLIEISRVGGARMDAKYCSDACRMKAYRTRRGLGTTQNRGRNAAELSSAEAEKVG